MGFGSQPRPDELTAHVHLFPENASLTNFTIIQARSQKPELIPSRLVICHTEVLPNLLEEEECPHFLGSFTTTTMTFWKVIMHQPWS